VRYSEKPIAEAAMGAEKPANRDTQPVRKPSSGWKRRDRKVYSPPALGMAAPSSP